MPPKKAVSGPKKAVSGPKSTASKKAAPASKAKSTTSKEVGKTAASAASTTTTGARRQTAATKRKAAEDAIAETPSTKKSAAKPSERKIAAPRPSRKAAAPPKESTTDASGSDKENEATKPRPVKANTKRKRAPSVKEDEAETELDEGIRPAKKTKKETIAKTVASSTAAPKRKIGKKINDAPTAPLDVFVFGEGSSGELGLGSVKVDGKKPIDVKRPRINHNLSAKDVGVVQIACGGMHVVALTKDNKILTWGVNDQGALGRDTSWDGGLRDADDEDSDAEDSDDTGVNPRESTPAEVDTTSIEPETKFTQVVASDSASFALTEDGYVYGWGTFRSSDGILGFTDKILVQRIPILVPDIKGIKQLAAGLNHVLALDVKGKVHAWGCGQQNQLGRKVFERDVKSSLKPNGVGNLPVRGAKPAKVACGSYHSFIIDQEGRVYAWGLNNFAELGIEDEAGEDNASQLKPRLVQSLGEHAIRDISGGEHHSLACTDDGKLLTWGRVDCYQVGLPKEAFTEDNAIFDEFKKPRILKVPTVVPGLLPIASVAAGTDNSFALTTEGKVYSWGFSANYQTGQGTDEEVEAPTMIDNTAVRDKKLVFAGAGGQYSIVASVAQELANGSA